MARSLQSAGSADHSPVYPTFGSMRYWHLVKNAPGGDLESRAIALRKIVCENQCRSADRWDVRPVQVRAMVLELTVAFALSGRPLTDEFLRLAAWAMDLPPNFISDPTPLFSGHDGRGQAADARVRSAAEWLDGYYFAEHGDLMALSALATKLRHVLALAEAPDRKTLRAWRSDPAYSHFVRTLKPSGDETQSEPSGEN